MHMNSVRTLLRTLLGLALAFGWTAAARSQSAPDALEVARSAIKADRQAVLAAGLNLTDGEAAAFWPLYREYRLEMDGIGDGLVKIVLEYADAYPAALEEAQATRLLKEFGALEAKWVATRSKYARRLAKVMPASKVLRFLQLENRLDLAMRLQLASAIPLVPTGIQ